MREEGEAHFRNDALEMAMMEQQITKCSNDWLGEPLSRTSLVDGQAAMALEDSDIVARQLDERFPAKVTADRMGEAMEDAFGLNIMKKRYHGGFQRWSEAAFHTVAERWRRPFVGGSRMLHPTRIYPPGSIGHAVVMSATHRSWDLTWSAQPSSRHSLDVHLTACHTGVFAVGELEKKKKNRGGRG